MKIGSHVGMSGKEMFLGSVKEALSYGADTLMVYTGAPQNTRRKAIEELRVEEGWELMTFSVTNSAKAILVFRLPNAA